jgi:hypothetical protein
MKILLSILLIPTAVMCFCCGGCSSSRERADAVWDRGDKVAAVRDYKVSYEEWFQSSSEKEKMLPRIVEFETKAGNTDEAKKWIRRGLDDQLRVEYSDPAAKELFVAVQKELEEARARAEAEAKDARAKAEAEAERTAKSSCPYS